MERTLFHGQPATIYTVWQWVAVVFTLGIAYVLYWMRSASTTYEITTQRIRIERGLLSTAKDTVELFCIDHFDLLKPFGMRLVGQCAVHLRSSDREFSSVVLYGIPGLEELSDRLRECSLRERTRRKVTTFVSA